jgi:hypothetical protein
MNVRTPAPPGLRWSGGVAGRWIVYVLIFFVLGLQIFQQVKINEIVECNRDRTAAAAKRTRALEGPTTREREAERLLVLGPREVATMYGREVTLIELRDAVLNAREQVDRARLANPAPDDRPCG